MSDRGGKNYKTDMIGYSRNPLQKDRQLNNNEGHSYSESYDYIGATVDNEGSDGRTTDPRSDAEFISTQKVMREPVSLGTDSRLQPVHDSCAMKQTKSLEFSDHLFTAKLVNVDNQPSQKHLSRKFNHYHTPDISGEKVQKMMPAPRVIVHRSPSDNKDSEIVRSVDSMTDQHSSIPIAYKKDCCESRMLDDRHNLTIQPDSCETEENYDDDEYYSAGAPNELVDLSRQLMVPMHELISFYQFIQQGDPAQTNSKGSLSPSRASERSKTNLNECEIRFPDNSTQSILSNRLDLANASNLDLKYSSDEPQIIKSQALVQHMDNTDGRLECRHESQSSDQQAGHEQRQPVSITKDKRRIRANVVLELINSERDFVKHLKDVVEGYLYPARRHPEIFTGERVNTIFSNIEQLYEFQRRFLEQLELCMNWENLADSQVGQCFLDHEKGFSVYHHYCNNHPNAISELQDLYTKPRFVKFFEACRLLQNMIDISLDGFLLTPIQKICKYPLQLNELLKNTSEDHPDYHPMKSALESMRNCAKLANERKRRIEALADVMLFQEKFENWFGSKLSDTSSMLIHSGEVSKMGGSHNWSQDVQLFLFDHLLLYARKDLLKRNSLILKGRICMDTVTEISDADEYKPKKSFKIYCGEQRKWFVFTTRNEKEKDDWIQAFERERNLVEADENEGFQITELEIGVAKRALQNRKHSRSARYKRKRPDTAIVDCQLDLDDANTIMNRTLSLPSCIHPSHVMNFVEDSKVVSSSSRKKTSSPNASSRSPTTSGNQFSGLDQLESSGTHSSSGGSWFRKMGSKKLSKSQVYNVNGAGSRLLSDPNSPTSLMASSTGGEGILVTNATNTSSTTTTPASSVNYDELEKRHRNHMVSEEQARLFRLNNDLPPPIFGSRVAPNSKIPQRSTSIVADNQPRASRPARQTPKQSLPQSRMHVQPDGNDIDPNKLDWKSCVVSTPSPPAPIIGRGPSEKINVVESPQHTRVEPTTFETTLVLSSGKVVRVREDAV